MDNPAFTKVRRNDLGKLIKHMQGLSMERIATDCGLSYAEAETLVPALMVYQELLRATKAKFIIVSPVTMRDGLLLELSRRCRGQQDATFGNEVLQSAEAIAEKYNTNLEHARKVAACSVVLYDELQPEHLLGNRHRILLEAAALLHEIGVYVAARAYHKHTYYLIVNSQLYGLTSMEVMLVAQIARYHRRSTPKPSHVEYTNLSRENRVIVNKLAAILRLAKTLDSSGMCDVDQLKCKLAGDKFLVRVAGLTDVSLRRHLLDVRSDYFEDVYGLTLEFEQG